MIAIGTQTSYTAPTEGPTTQKPTTTQSTTPKPPDKRKKRMKQVMTLHHIDYDKVIADPTLKASIIDKVVQSYLEVLPQGYTEDHINVTLTNGSVKATVEVIPPEGVQTTDLQRTFADVNVRNALEGKVLANVKTIQNLDTVMES